MATPTMNASSPLTVVAHVKAKPGREDDLRALLASMVVPTRGEEGCLNYDLHQAIDDPCQFMFHENWRCHADLDVHLKSPHVTAVLARVGDLVDGEPRITLWKRVA